MLQVYIIGLNFRNQKVPLYQLYFIIYISLKMPIWTCVLCFVYQIPADVKLLAREPRCTSNFFVAEGHSERNGTKPRGQYENGY